MPDTDYGYALKMGRKRYQDALARGEYPYLPVLDNILANTDIVATVNLGNGYSSGKNGRDKDCRAFQLLCQ